MRRIQAHLHQKFDDKGVLINYARKKRGSRPLFVAVEIVTLDGDECAGFVRNIAYKSLGLFTNCPLPERRLRVVIPDLRGQRFELLAEVISCSPIYSGWFASETDLVAERQLDSLRLWLTRQIDSLNRRHSVRYPLFEPAQLLPSGGALQQVLVRDVSDNGIGLAHSDVVNSDIGLLIGPHGSEVNVSRIWQRACSENMVLSGWRFHQKSSPHIESL